MIALWNCFQRGFCFIIHSTQSLARSPALSQISITHMCAHIQFAIVFLIMDLHVRAFISPSNRNALDRSIYFIWWHKKLNLFFHLPSVFSFVMLTAVYVCVCALCNKVPPVLLECVFTTIFNFVSNSPSGNSNVGNSAFLFSQVNGTVFFAAVVVVAMNHMQKQKIETAVYFLKIFIIRCASGDGGKVNQCVNKLCVCDCAYTVRIYVCVCELTHVSLYFLLFCFFVLI